MIIDRAPALALLQGDKTAEVRNTAWSHEGRLGLIVDGHILGEVVKYDDVAMSIEEVRSADHMTQLTSLGVPPYETNNHLWMMSDPVQYTMPVRVALKQGHQKWVNTLSVLPSLTSYTGRI